MEKRDKIIKLCITITKILCILYFMNIFIEYVDTLEYTDFRVLISVLLFCSLVSNFYLITIMKRSENKK